MNDQKIGARLVVKDRDGRVNGDLLPSATCCGG